MARVASKLRDLTCGKYVRHVAENLSELEGTSQVEVTHDKSESGTAMVTGADVPADGMLTKTIENAGDHTVETTECQ